MSYIELLPRLQLVTSKLNQFTQLNGMRKRIDTIVTYMASF